MTKLLSGWNDFRVGCINDKYLFLLQLVGSAPQFPHGIIDSIEEICEVSQLNELLDMILKL